MKKQSRTRVDQRSGVDIDQAAKPVEKELNKMLKGTDKRGKRVSGNQDIPILLQLIGFGATLHVYPTLDSH